MKEKMYIHSTDSSCEKTKQEKQKNFSILLLKKQKKTLKKRKLPDEKKLPHSPLKIKKRKFDFDIMCHQFLHAFCLFCHVLPHTTTTIYYSENKTKNSSKLLRFSLILFSHHSETFLMFQEKLPENVDNERKPKSFPFLNSPLPHVSCQL